MGENTYKLCQKLRDNYNILSDVRETTTPEENKEVDDFINGIKDTAPMKIARQYLYPNGDISNDQWVEIIKERWFTVFGSDDRSGFEHVFVGENSGSRSKTNIGGYHFWYKYYIDDSEENVTGKDTIDFGKINFGESKLNDEGKSVPEVVTL